MIHWKPRRAQESPGSPGEPRRGQGSPEEPRRAQGDPREPGGTQENPGEPTGAQENGGRFGEGARQCEGGRMTNVDLDDDDGRPSVTKS